MSNDTDTSHLPQAGGEAEDAMAAFANSQPAGAASQLAPQAGAEQAPVSGLVTAAPAAAIPDDGFLDGGEVSNQEDRPLLSFEERHPEYAKAKTELEPWGEMSGTEFLPHDPVLFLPPGTLKDTQDKLNLAPNLEPTEESERLERLLQGSFESTPPAGQFVETVRRENSDWRQFIQHEAARLGVSVPKAEAVGDGEIITGSRAVLRVRQHVGLGTLIQVPLWHSGYWATFKAPEDEMMLELYRRLREEKTQLGRQTYGLSFANTSVYYNQWLLDFALDHIYDTTLKSGIDLRANTSTLDIPLLIWGLACAHYPRGFQYGRAVVGEKGELVKEVRGRLHVGRCLWTDYNSLTPWQVGTHMARRASASTTVEMLERYKSEFTRGAEREVDLGKDIKVTFAVPSIADYQASGQKWVNNIVHLFNSTLTDEVDEAARNRHLLQQGKATNMRQYGHWVKKITSRTNDIVDLETIESTLNVLSADDDIRRAFFKAVQKYIDDSTISLIATPTVHPAEDKRTLPRFDHLLPLDVPNTFFTLLVQKQMRIEARSSF